MPVHHAYLQGTPRPPPPPLPRSTAMSLKPRHACNASKPICRSRSRSAVPTRRRSVSSPPPSLSQEKDVVEYLDHDLGCHMPGRVVVREGSDYLVKPLIDDNTNYQERAVSAAEIRPLPNKEVGPGASADELKVGMKLESWFPEDGRWVGGGGGPRATRTPDMRRKSYTNIGVLKPYPNFTTLRQPCTPSDVFDARSIRKIQSDFNSSGANIHQ